MTHICLSGDGQYLATGSEDRNFRVFKLFAASDGDGPKIAPTPVVTGSKAGANWMARGAAFARDNSFIAIASDDRCLRILQVQHGPEESQGAIRVVEKPVFKIPHGAAVEGAYSALTRELKKYGQRSFSAQSGGSELPNTVSSF